MTFAPFAPFASAHIKLNSERIDPADAARQARTAGLVLDKLHDQPGVILADEVGMGKTFVALAVAASIIIDDPFGGPVVVMMPPSVREKWPSDWKVFRDLCLHGRATKWFTFGVADSGAQFLQLLDKKGPERERLIFLSHGALHSTLRDGFFKLAFIKRAFWHRPSLAKQRRAFPKFAGKILELKSKVENKAEGLLGELLDRPREAWLELMYRAHDSFREKYKDHPVPLQVQNQLDSMDQREFDELAEALSQLPLKESTTINERIKAAREALKGVIARIWRKVLQNAEFESPLLVLDEAHHLKNPNTRLASLFYVNEDDEDESKELATDGALANKFARMLFLTATPFQLGHRELISVLDRFDGIAWEGNRRPARMSRLEFATLRKQLLLTLDGSQLAAIAFDRVWGKVTTQYLLGNDGKMRSSDEWWNDLKAQPDSADKEIIRLSKEAENWARGAERQLSQWVIRNRKSAKLSSNTAVDRRLNLPGAAICDHGSLDEGLEVRGEALLPFLLAARAQTILKDSGHERNTFAEGLASSFEAYRFTRQDRDDIDQELEGTSLLDTGIGKPAPVPEPVKWYLEHIDRSLSTVEGGARIEHPKVQATTERAVQLWRKGHKVLIFCHYRATGRALRQNISRQLRDEIDRLAKQKLPHLTDTEVQEELERIARRFDAAGPIRRAVDDALHDLILLNTHRSYDDTHAKHIVEIVRRFLRTPSFLVRYLDLQRLDDPDVFASAIDRDDIGGLSLRQRITDLSMFLSRLTHENELPAYLDALDRYQTRGHTARDAESIFDKAEFKESEGRAILIPNVRLANGESSAESRRRLLLTFNTPLYPEILIASRVLAEGVDLHLNCRHVIHHDLDWNPSIIEQRTGRLDRIGSHSEKVQQPIQVYLPYVAGTQDEKMYRVVMDRARWFEIVMGEKYASDPLVAEQRAERVPLPQELANRLALHLSNEASVLTEAPSAARSR